MKCADFESRLQELLDARLPLEADDLLAAHASLCDTCRQQLTAFSLLAAEVASRPRPLPAADLASRVMADLSATQVERPVVVSRTSWLAYAVAAALLIAAFPLWRWFNEGGEESGATVAVVPQVKNQSLSAPAPPAEPTAQAEVTDPPIGDLVREVGDRYMNLAQETQASYAELALLLPGVRAPEHRDGDAPEGDVAAAEDAGSRGWVNDMTEGLKPVTNSTVGAFSFLLEALPTEVPAEKL